MTFAMLAVALIALLGLSIVTPMVNWQRVFPVAHPLPGEAAWAFWWAGACILGGLVSGIPSAVYIAYQETHRNNFWEAIAKVLSWAACFGVIRGDWGVVGVTIALTGVPTLVRLLNLTDMFVREKRWVAPSLKLFDGGLLRSMLFQGLLLFILQM